MNRLGAQTFVYPSKPSIRAAAAIVGPKEGQGPMRDWFDEVLTDDKLGMPTYEQAESELLRRTIAKCLEKGGRTEKTVEAMLCGDLLNQITASGFAGRALGIPFLGMYGACSTMVQTLVVASALIDGGFLNSAVCGASSHFCSAERQYRFPLELGNQRPPSAQWTATAAGAALVEKHHAGDVCVTHGTLGCVTDYDIKDANHMGAAMAPAVCDTLLKHFEDTGRGGDDYDLVVTGDLGYIGRDILLELVSQRGINLTPEKLMDCGASLYYKEQDVHAGGSGCGCIASVLCGHFITKLQTGDFRRILALGSGAMLSPGTSQQGESIPSISYAVALEGVKR